jgi:uncharacterized RDD family membrane protein YckC
MTQPSGWYDDPNDAGQLRYWDGVVWTDHVAPRKSPTVEQSRIGMPHEVGNPTPHAGQQRGQTGWPGQLDRQGQQRPGAPQWPGVQLGRPQPTTPDGAVLSGWWRRVVARVVDGIICGLVTVAVTYPWLTRAAGIMNGYFRDTFDAAANGGTAPSMPSGLASALLPISLASLAIYFVYEVVLLTLFATTPGRLLVGISVRLREQPGTPPLSAVLRRTVVKEGGSAIGLLPVLGLAGSLFTMLDSLWPLRDDRRQALHDKVGVTNVVIGQQRRGGGPPPVSGS